MKARNIALGSALALALLAAWWSSRQPPAARDAATATKAASAAPRAKASEPFPRELLAVLMAPRLSAEPKGTPFSAPPPPPPPARTTQPADPGPPQFPYAVIGRLDIPGERPRVVLSRGDDLREVREGSPIDAAFLLKGVTEGGLVLEFRPDGRSWVLPYGSGHRAAPGTQPRAAPDSRAPGVPPGAPEATGEAGSPANPAFPGGASAGMSIDVTGRETPMESAPPVRGQTMESRAPVPGQGMGAAKASAGQMVGLPERKRGKGN